MPIHVLYLVCGLTLMVLGIAGLAWALCRAAARSDQLMREADENRRRYTKAGR